MPDEQEPPICRGVRLTPKGIRAVKAGMLRERVVHHLERLIEGYVVPPAPIDVAPATERLTALRAADWAEPDAIGPLNASAIEWFHAIGAPLPDDAVDATRGA
ncbi:MAG: hypothetical protein ACHREM_00405 [Polyangiales bacterium]